MVNRTPNLGLPLDFLGHVQTEQHLQEAFAILDDAVGGTATPPDAADVPVTAIADTTGDNVQAVLEDIAARLKVLEDL